MIPFPFRLYRMSSYQTNVATGEAVVDVVEACLHQVDEDKGQEVGESV